MNQYDQMPGLYDTTAPSRQRGRIAGWVLALIGIIGVVFIVVVLAVGWFIYAVAHSPDTFVYSGNQVPSKYVESAENLGLITPNESVLFLYSDAMFDVEDAMYILTDQHLVLYNKQWPDPKKVIAFKEIVTVNASWSQDWIVDSSVSVELDDGNYWTFPLSMEGGTDRRFVEKLCESAGVPTPP